MLQRTALGQLCDWKRTKTQQALMIMGARQVGKIACRIVVYEGGPAAPGIVAP